MKKILYWVTGCLFLCACQNNSTDKTTSTDSAASAKPVTQAPVELADSSFNSIGDKALSDFAKGDFDAYSSVYADNIHLDLAGGDSVIGKTNLIKYWKNTLAGVDSVRFNKPIYVSLKVNQSTQIQTGKWLLMWYDFTLYLKNGKKLTGHTHDVVHLTAENKTDYQLHYADNAPILAAMKAK